MYSYFSALIIGLICAPVLVQSWITSPSIQIVQQAPPVKIHASSLAFLPTMSRLKMSSSNPDTMAFASQDEILSAMAKEDTVILDARRMDEIEATGKIATNLKWYQTTCTPDACPTLETEAENMFPNKDGKFYCIFRFLPDFRIAVFSWLTLSLSWQQRLLFIVRPGSAPKKPRKYWKAKDIQVSWMAEPIRSWKKFWDNNWIHHNKKYVCPLSFKRR